MKNSVLILDDVWEKIDMLKVGCTFSVEFCRLIITTRSLEVCRRIGCKKLIPVVKLGKDEAWMLFNETLENETTLGVQVEEIAKSMAGLCNGLPLGIITVAGSMKGETTIHTWQNALAELKVCVAGGQDEMGEVDEVFKVLKYSFDQLNRNCQNESNEFNRFQLCFMYCSLYPEDYEIVRHELVGKFISEGLVDEKKSRRAQVQQGHSILDKLVNLCLLESCVNFENMKCVKMHDLVRSMALKIHKGKYMVRAFDRSLLDIFEEEWKKDLEKVSFMKSGTYRIGEGISPDCPKLSTLLLWGNYNLKVIPESFFSKLQGLFTLDLSRTGIRLLPNSVSDLTCLKALLLENCRGLETVPYVGKLKALRELNLSNTAIKEAPQGLEELLSLRFLSIDAPQLKIIPGGLLLKLEHLQHLNLPLHMQVVIDEIKNLKQLEEFRGAMKSVGDFNWFIKTRVVHDPYYRIQVNSNFNTGHSGFGIEEDLGSGTNELMLSYCNLEDEKVLGQGIAYLTIRECKDVSKCFVDDLAPRFDNPTSLRKLKIRRCGGIEWILRSDGHGSYINTLEDIHLWGLDDLKGVVMATAPTQSLVFSSLKYLYIDVCNKMRKVGLPVSALPNLETIRINRCGEIEEILEGDEGGAASIVATLPRLKQLWLHTLPRLRKVGLPVWVVPNLEEIHIRNCGEIEEILEEDERRGTSILTTLTLPKLKELSLCELPRLKNVSKTTIISNSIQTIYIRKCPRLKNKLPLHFDDLTPPPTLESILVEREWWESLEWDTNIHPNLPQLLLPLVEFQDR